jgi:thioredoxin-like negative regulator of GroEL
VENRIEEPVPEATEDSLSLFSKSLKSGDKTAAASHLAVYVHQHPEQAMFRLQLAELLIQTKCDDKARVHFEQFVASAQAGPDAVRKYLVHAHTRLMEIAQRADDPFGEPFHRGVGLLILVQEQDKNPERDEAFCEEMLCKALRALNEARQQKPGDSRVRVYLAEVYDRMGNRRASTNERSRARNGAAPGQLTKWEQALAFIPGL